MRNILSYDKFSINESFFSEIKDAILGKKKLDNEIEKIFKDIKNDFNIKKLKYSGTNFDPRENKMEYYIYEFQKNSYIKIVKENYCDFNGGSYTIGPTTFSIFFNDDEITRLISSKLKKQIYNFFESKENNRDSETLKRKDDKVYRRIKDQLNRKPDIDPASR